MYICMHRIYPTAAVPAQSYTVYWLFSMCDLSFKNRYLIIVNWYMPSGPKMGKKDYISLYNCCCIVKLLFEMCIPVSYKNKNVYFSYMQIINFCDNLKMKSLVYIIMIIYHQGRLMTVQTAKTKCTLTTLLNVFLMPFFSKLIIFVYFSRRHSPCIP